MHPATLRALEFDRVREALASFALTPLGAGRLATLEPESDRSRVAKGLAATTEGVRLLSDGPGLPLRAPADLDETLDALTVEGRPLEPLRLVGLADFVHSIEQSRASILRQTRQSLPILSALAARISSFEREVADVRRAIDPAGDVVDSASPALRTIRENLRRARSRLRTTLESFMRARDTAKYLQDQVVTDRNGRYVLVVKSENRTSIPGIVHGASSSGASLYLEPLGTVELNNDIVSLQEEEKEEVLRILLALTDAFRRRDEDLAETLEAATELDVIQAKARLAALSNAIAPKLSTDGRLELRGARHPLLIEGVVARTRDESGTRVTRAIEPVPVDVLLIPPTRVLVITGPNTGGKTVALKCAGLLPLMAQAGLHIPVEDGSQVPVFETVFADIGDEQSIAANLSTFSSHITNIAAMDRTLAVPALVLLDEVGAGTDPIEGGALGMAIIDHFRQRGALLVATTHYDALKSYASTTPEVTAAAFGFNPETFAPTYRLLYGSPGTSLALEMSARLGLPASIVHAAREFRTARDAQLADHLAKIDHDLHAIDHERRELARERTQVAQTQAQFEAREDSLRQREEQVKRRLETSVKQEMREARREIDQVVEDLKKRAAALEDEQKRAAAQPRLVTTTARLSTGDTGNLRTDARTALEQIAARLRQDEAGRPAPAVTRSRSIQTADASAGSHPFGSIAESASPSPEPDAPAPPPKPLAIIVGMRVTVGPLGLEGIVQGVQGHTAEVNVRGKRLRAHVEDLQPVGGPGKSGGGGAGVGTRTGVLVGAGAGSGASGGGRGGRSAASETSASESVRVRVNVQANAPEGTSSDLNLVGFTVADATDRVDKFLDRALLTEQRQVRLIHGHGTGQLRRGLAEFLQGHPLVERFALATPEQGGGGVTIVDLKE
jgi:DNA mismatch repair protein MutS2